MKFLSGFEISLEISVKGGLDGLIAENFLVRMLELRLIIISTSSNPFSAV